MIQDIIDEIRETAKGTALERLQRIEFSIQEVKRRLERIDKKLQEEDA